MERSMTVCCVLLSVAVGPAAGQRVAGTSHATGSLGALGTFGVGGTFRVGGPAPFGGDSNHRVPTGPCPLAPSAATAFPDGPGGHQVGADARQQVDADEAPSPARVILFSTIGSALGLVASVKICEDGCSLAAAFTPPVALSAGGAVGGGGEVGGAVLGALFGAAAGVGAVALSQDLDAILLFPLIQGLVTGAFASAR